MDFGQDDDRVAIILRVNGGINKVKQEHVCELQDRNSQRLIDILKEAGRNFNQKDKYKQARLYNMKGLEILDEDVQFMKHNDVFYVAFDGEEFNNCALLDEYEIGAVLGEGGYGKVVLAKHISTKRKVAIKFMDIQEQLQSASAVQSIFKEASNLKKLRHKNIIELHHAFVEKKQLIMIMEYAGGGELLEYVQKVGTLNEIDARNITLQLVNSILYCHQRGIIHRDLKLENVIFRDAWDAEEDGETRKDLFVKVIDFGIAGVCENGKSEKNDAGSLCYMSPECLQGSAIDSVPSIDVWGIGIMFYAMIYGTLPFYGTSEEQTIKLIKTAPLRFEKDVVLSPTAREVITKMLDRDPAKRLDLMDLMDMDFYKMDDEAYEQMVDEVKSKWNELKEESKNNDLQKDAVKVQIPSPKGKGGRPAMQFGKPKESVPSPSTPGMRGAGSLAKPNKTPITKK